MKERAQKQDGIRGGREPSRPTKGPTTARDAVLELQRTAGNAAVDELLSQRPLDAPLRSTLEERFGVDLSHVRVHADAEGAQRALDEGAAAVTTGADVHFAPGRYRPETEAGRALIAHEVAHVVQLTRNGDEPLLGRAELEAEAAGGGAVAGRAAAGMALHADEQILEDAKRAELKRILTADKDAWMNYLDHPIYSQILHDDLEIGRALVGDPRFRRWLDKPGYRPKPVAKVTPATEPVQSTPAVERTPMTVRPEERPVAKQSESPPPLPAGQRDWGREWEHMSGEERARSAYEELVHPSKRQELPPIPVYYTPEMAELDRMPGVLRVVSGGEIGWRAAELAWGETAGTGLEIDREEKAKELALVVGKEIVMNWAAGRVVEGVTTLDELRSAALAMDEAAKAALMPTTAIIPGRVPVRGHGRVTGSGPRGAGASAVKSVKPSPWKAPPPSFKPAGGGGGVGMRLQPEPVAQPGGTGVGLRPTPVANPALRPMEGTTGGKAPAGGDYEGPFQDSVERLAKASAKAAPPAPQAAPGGTGPQAGKAPTVWLPGPPGEDVQAPPVERRPPVTEKETPTPIETDPKPEQTIGRIDPEPEGGAEPLQLAGKSSAKGKAKKTKPEKKSDETSLEGDPSDPTPVMDPAEEARYTQFSPDVNPAKFRRQFMQTPPPGGGTKKWGHSELTWDEAGNLVEESRTLIESGVRDPKALRNLPGSKPGDEAGHLSRVEFGHVDAIWGKSGVVPQARSVNTGGGAWWKAENKALAEALKRQRAGQPFKLRSEAKGFKNGRPSYTRISVLDENGVEVYDSLWIPNP